MKIVSMQRFTQQRGSALAVGLLILLVMTLIGVTAMQTTSMEEKMAGNMRDRNLAFQVAESALRAGENYIRITSLLPAFSNTNGLYQYSNLVSHSWYKDDDTWWLNLSNVKKFFTDNSTGTGRFSSVTTGTAYVLEELPQVPDPTQSQEAGIPINASYYRVTARGVGGTTNAVVIVQSVYKR